MNEMFNEHISYFTQISYEVKTYSNYIKRYVNQKEKIKNCHLNNSLDDLSWTTLNSDKAVLERITRPCGLTSRCHLPRNLQIRPPCALGSLTACLTSQQLLRELVPLSARKVN